MKYGTRTHGGASCEVHACMAVPERMRKDIREISKLYCSPEARHRGDATALLESICRQADEKKMVLMLVPEAYGDEPPLPTAFLTEWYERTFNFRPIQAEPLILARMYDPYRKPVLAEKIGQIITEGIR